MHEVALAQALWRQVEAEMAARPGQRLLAVSGVVGRWSGADPESLEFAVGLMAAESPWPAVAVRLRSEPLALRCRACGREFEPEALDLACPGCGAYEAEGLRGREVRLESIEIEEAPTEA
jgi:hydrogenase nickel incorporation protein HypA/HybF